MRPHTNDNARPRKGQGTMSFTLRELLPSDGEQLTEIARASLFLDQIPEGLIAEKCWAAHDQLPELGLVAVVGEQILGFIQGAVGVNKEDRHRGYVRLLAVAPAAQRQGVGSALLSELEKRFMARGLKEVSVMDVPQNYFMPGLDFRYTAAVCFFLRHGYTMLHENHNMLCDVSEERWGDLDKQVAAMQDTGFEVRRAELPDWERLESFLRAYWPAWRDEVSRALHSPERKVFIAVCNGEVVGFAAYQGNNAALPWFGPMGTSPDCRGKGIGALLLRLCLRELARQGWRQAIIPWVGPICFYAKFCDAWLSRCFWVYRKSLAKA